MDIIALIPAAGKGSRYGMPKVDAVYNGITFSERIQAVLKESGITIIYLLRDLDTPDMLATIRYGIKKALSEEHNPDGWIIWPVDHPNIQKDTILTLIDTFSRNRNCIIIPRYDNKNGHPVVIPMSLAIPDETPPAGLKEVIMLSHIPVLHVDVNDPGILVNINTPEDVKYV